MPIPILGRVGPARGRESANDCARNQAHTLSFRRTREYIAFVLDANPRRVIVLITKNLNDDLRRWIPHALRHPLLILVLQLIELPVDAALREQFLVGTALP